MLLETRLTDTLYRVANSKLHSMARCSFTTYSTIKLAGYNVINNIQPQATATILTISGVKGIEYFWQIVLTNPSAIIRINYS